MQTVTDLLTTAIRAFNLESFQAGQVSDIMANAINKSKLTVDKLRIAFNYVGPAAYAVGAELEEVAAAMMTLANSGLRASTIGTGLRQVFSRLVAPSAKLREAFEEHGISLEDLNVKVHGFVGVMHNLSEVFVDAESGAIDAQKAFELFGLRGANSVLALMKGINSGEFQEALTWPESRLKDCPCRSRTCRTDSSP
jgi:TP901 family phage tail tape measure protein